MIDYHADHSRLSHSMIEVYRKSPQRYYRRFVKQDLEPDPPTPGMMVGTLAHVLILEPAKWFERFVVAECPKRAGGVWKKALEDAEGDGKEAVLRKDTRVATEISRSVFGHPEAKMLVTASGPVEEPVYWEDDTGLRCKCKPDKLIGRMCVDLKTTADPSPEAFGRVAWNLGYHRTAAWYLDGTGAGEFLIIAVGQKPPHDVWVYRVSPAYVRLGRQQNTETACAIAAAAESDYWGAPGQDELQLLEPPAWAREK